jgi:hypothetical protein
VRTQRSKFEKMDALQSGLLGERRSVNGDLKLKLGLECVGKAPFPIPKIRIRCSLTGCGVRHDRFT